MNMSFVLPEAPEIHVEEKTILVNNGDTATLRCETEGIPPPDITWYKGEYEVRVV